MAMTFGQLPLVLMGRELLAAVLDGEIIIWDTQTGDPVKKLSGHNNAVRSVRFSPTDSNLLASGSADRTVRIWDIEQGQQIGPALTGHTDSVWAIVFSSKGNRVLSASADLSLRIWPTYWQEWPEMACERIAYHPILRKPERIFAQSNQDSLDMAEQTKLACEKAFWRKP